MTAIAGIGLIAYVSLIAARRNVALNEVRQLGIKLVSEPILCGEEYFVSLPESELNEKKLRAISMLGLSHLCYMTLEITCDVSDAPRLKDMNFAGIDMLIFAGECLDSPTLEYLAKKWPDCAVVMHSNSLEMH